MSRAPKLQDVLNVVYNGAIQETADIEHRSARAGFHMNSHHATNRIVENVKAELLRRGLFTEEEPSGAV